MRQLARAIYKNTVPAKGTLVERYLRAHCATTATLPACLRFHSSLYIKRYNRCFPAIVVALKNDKNSVQQVHMTLLNGKTGKKVNVPQATLKFGPTPDNFYLPVATNRTASQVTLVVEGVETALNVKSALQHCNVQAVFEKSDLQRLNVDKLTKQVVVLLNDNLGNKTHTQSIKTKLEHVGKEVKFLLSRSQNHNTKEFNDALSLLQREVNQQTSKSSKQLKNFAKNVFYSK